ncbi:NAD(P)-binding protein [Lindgomyces ingoldianus]|uniref:NAD(P)-binding protein n=1 Tax=Lindgomyces ingoldianus TaxID=673940 RepID=A0ACB6RA77_9PLEO|nr:NAD(P)-binding protein [Lindgomyces ingoldianus]KAF2475965.1 NAD(P)-binding protein [Lindgomyces ingoldianus]
MPWYFMERQPEAARKEYPGASTPMAGTSDAIMGSMPEFNASKRYILITGAGGFIGQELTIALLSAAPDIELVLADVFKPPLPLSKNNTTNTETDTSRVHCIEADLTRPPIVATLLNSKKWHACYLLHGIMSSGSETNLEFGLAVNIDSHRLILDFLRRHQPGVIVVFPSSLAVYGPPEGTEVVSERTIALPQSSYGAEKLVIETLVNDYSRRGLIDGRVVRLPTVIVRPGRPSAAASSFASSIVREPLRGEKSLLPVSRSLEMWVCSPETVVRNLVAVKDVPKDRFGRNKGRVVNLPGQTVKVGEILEALEEVGGKEAVGLVEEKVDPRVEDIVASWPSRFDVSVAKGLGMVEDVSLTEVLYWACQKSDDCWPKMMHGMLKTTIILDRSTRYTSMPSKPPKQNPLLLNPPIYLCLLILLLFRDVWSGHRVQSILNIASRISDSFTP